MRKSMKSKRTQWNSFQKLKIIEKSLEINGHQYKSLEINGNQRKPIENQLKNENQWESLQNQGKWKIERSIGNPRKSKKTNNKQ